MTFDHSRSYQVRRLIVLGLFVPCLLISIPAFFAYRAEHQLADSFHWVSHTITVERQLQNVMSAVVDAETGQRGFLLTSQESFLEPYHSALERLPSQTAMLRGLTMDNPAQQENVRKLEPLIAAKLSHMAETIALEQQGSHEAAVTLTKSGRGRQAMDAIRTQIEAMGAEEARLLTSREQHLSARARFNTVILSTIVALNLAFALAIFVMLRQLEKIRSLVTICAWSRTVEYEGEWLSFEQYLLRRFKLDTSHGISPAEMEKAFGDLAAKS